jgi:uncharacterized membrane protein HdeD (DUF308 family)
LPEAEASTRADDLTALFGGESLADFRETLTSHWWVFLARGLLAIAFGVLALVQPAAALVALVLLFGAWAFVDGIMALSVAIAGRRRSWQLVLSGLVGIGVGLLTLFRPGITALGLFLTVAAWAIARGVLEIVTAVELRKQIQGEFWFILGGIASILFGVLLVVLPMAGLLALAWLIGVYAIAFGVLMLGLSFRLRQRRVATSARAPLVGAEPRPA